MTLTLGTHKSLCIHLVDFMCLHSDQRRQKYLGNLLLNLLYKHLREQISPCHKKVKVNPESSSEQTW